MEQDMVANRGEEDQLIELPPGFRFHPTDEEIITSYLTEKVIDSSFVAIAIGEADLNKCEPWDLPKKAKMGEKEWYFFCQRDRKYPTGMRTNRATESGYWKATGKDKEIFNNKGKSGCLVGMKKTLVFYRGRAPKGEKTNWVMHEYRLEGKISQYTNLSKAAKDEWVVCRVFHKNMGLKKTPTRMNSFGDHDLLDYSSLPPLMDPTSFNNNIMNNNDNKACGYGDHDVKPGTNLASTAPSLSSAKASSSDDHHAINNNNYLSYFSIGGSGGQVQKPNFSFQVQPTSSYYQATSLSNPNMLYPHHHQFQNPNPNPNPNPSSFWFQPNPNNSDYFQQGMIRVTNNTASDHDEDDQAMLRAIAAANNNNNNNNSNMNNETSSSAAAGFGSSGGLERQCKVEQFSSAPQSMFSISQDTGISTDINTTEISSSLVSSKQELGSTADNCSSYDQRPSVVPISDIEGLWDF